MACSTVRAQNLATLAMISSALFVHTNGFGSSFVSAM